MKKYPVSNPRNNKAKIKRYLGLIVTALLFDLIVLSAIYISCS